MPLLGSWRSGSGRNMLKGHILFLRQARSEKRIYGTREHRERVWHTRPPFPAAKKILGTNDKSFIIFDIKIRYETYVIFYLHRFAVAYVLLLLAANCSRKSHPQLIALKLFRNSTTPLAAALGRPEEPPNVFPLPACVCFVTNQSFDVS